MIRILAVAGIVAMFGCPALADPSTPSADPAQPDVLITFVKGYKSGFGNSPTTIYGISQNDDCGDIQYLDRLAWFTRDSRQVRVPAGKRVYVLAGTDYFYTSSVSVTPYGVNANVDRNGCGESASFTAEADHSYTVTQEAVFRGKCTLRVVDLQTGQSPSSLQMGLPESCKMSDLPKKIVEHPESDPKPDGHK